MIARNLTSQGVPRIIVLLAVNRFPNSVHKPVLRYEVFTAVNFHCSQLVPILSQICPVYAIPLCFFKIRFTIILPSMARFSEWSLPFKSSNQIFVWISHRLISRTCPIHLILLDSIILITFRSFLPHVNTRYKHIYFKQLYFYKMLHCHKFPGPSYWYYSMKRH
jgi:hypothetical protein